MPVGPSPTDERGARHFRENSIPRSPQKLRQSLHLPERPTPMIDAPGRLMLREPKHARALDKHLPGSMLPILLSEKTGSIVHGVAGRDVPGWVGEPGIYPPCETLDLGWGRDPSDMMMDKVELFGPFCTTSLSASWILPSSREGVPYLAAPFIKPPFMAPFPLDV